MGAQPFEQGVSKARQDKSPLVGPPLGTGSAIRKQTQLLVLDPVLHVAPGTVLLVVEFEAVVIAGADDKPGVGAQLAFFQSGDHPARVFPGLGLVPKAGI